MLWLSVALAIVISLVALAYVLWPILHGGPTTVLVEDDRLSELLARKDAVLASIKDLEFDYNVGKVSQEDLARFDDRLRRQAIGLMQQIEKIAPTTTALDDQLEREIARLRKTQDARLVRPLESASLTPPAQPSIVAVRPGQEMTKARFCINCGQPVDSAQNFCGHCGTPIAAVAVNVSPAEA